MKDTNRTARAAIILCSVAPAIFSQARAETKPGLVAHWDFDEGRGDVLRDTSGNGNDGAIHGAKWVKSGKGYALRFDGVNDYVDCGAGPSLDIRDAITLQAWVMPTAANRGEPGIAGKFWRSYLLTYYGHAYFYICSGTIRGTHGRILWNDGR